MLKVIVRIFVWICILIPYYTQGQNTYISINNDSILCMGNYSDSYFPLKLGYSWTYAGHTFIMKVQVNEMIIFEDQKYFEVYYNEGDMNKFERYLRIAHNGDIYSFQKPCNKEFLYIPANPMFNQLLADYPYTLGVKKRKVTALNSTVKTPWCTYTNCLEITEFDQDGSVNTTYHYKRGLGLVKQETFTPYYIYSVRL
jgi:hypothetical protein